MPDPDDESIEVSDEVTEGAGEARRGRYLPGSGNGKSVASVISSFVAPPLDDHVLVHCTYTCGTVSDGFP